jgi:hypothetical protein
MIKEEKFDKIRQYFLKVTKHFCFAKAYIKRMKKNYNLCKSVHRLYSQQRTAVRDI